MTTSITNKHTAKKVCDAAFAASQALNASIFDVLETASEDELKTYKRAVGQCMGELWTEIIHPVLKQHPDLSPKDLEHIFKT